MTYDQVVDLANNPGVMVLMAVVTFAIVWGILALINRRHW
jgi:hypothetical protein